QQYIDRQVELRGRAWEEAKSLLDHAASEARDLSGEEQAQYDRIVADIERYDESIKRFRADAEREARAAEARIEVPVAPVATVRTETDNDILRSLLTGEIRGHVFETRNTATPMSTSADAELVPQGFYDQIQEILRFTGPAFQPGLYTILNTASGNDIKVPRQTAFSAATATAEGAQFAVSNPTGESFTLKALKVGVLLKTSREIIEDSGIPLVPYLARQAGEAVGYKVNDLLAVGTGTVEPKGIFDAAGSGVTGGTASGAFTADNLIDLLHSVDSAVAARPATALQMSRATLGAVRKLKDGDGRYLFEYGAAGEPRILGERIVENPFAPAIGAGNKSVIYGDMSSYHVRQVGGIEVARSDDFAFDTDEVVWRVSMRVWGDLGQSANVKYFAGGS
ncbi:MAG TPA: phage major capsid protein, partial [Acidimicrobiia bacterium]